MKFSLRTWFLRQLLRRLRTARTVARLAFFVYRSRPALIDRRGTLTYGELRDRVLRLNAWMEDNGVGHGSVVFTWLPETGEQYEARLATYENGSILATFHKHLSSEAALSMLLRLRPEVFIHDPDLSADILHEVKRQMPGMPTLALGEDYEQALRNQPPRAGHVLIQEDDIFALHMTSGTTGAPKSIGYSNRKYLDSVRLIVDAVDLAPPQKGHDLNMLGMPLTGPGSGMVLPTLLAGGALVMPEDFQGATLLRLIDRHKVTRAFFSPSALIDMLDEARLDEFDLSSLKLALYGSEMMPAAKLAEAIRRFGPIFQQGYGSLEALPPIAWLLPHEHVDAKGDPLGVEVLASVGRVMPGVELAIRDGSWNPVPPGTTGMITVRSPVQFEGYWGDPEKSQEVLRDGWVQIGDVGYFDANGFLHVLGRAADRVQRNGRWIDPRAVEECAHAHPAVKEACLVQSGEKALLAVSLRHAWRAKPDASVSSNLLHHLSSRLHGDLLPDSIHVLETIPRSFLNKMLRREVRQMFDGPAEANNSGLLFTSRQTAPVPPQKAAT